MRSDTNLCDVTLACEDGDQFEAHKVILASSSPLFSDRIKINKLPHPLIYMRGLRSEDLAIMLDVLYFGETKVYQENLKEFLALAVELKLNGVTDSSTENKHSGSFDPVLKPEDTELTPKEENSYNIESYPKERPSNNPAKSVACTDDNTLSAEIQHLDDQINSLMELGKHIAVEHHK